MDTASLRQRIAAGPLGGHGTLVASLTCFWAFHFVVLWTSSFALADPSANLDLNGDLTWLIAVVCNSLALLGCILWLRQRSLPSVSLSWVGCVLVACGIALVGARVAWEGLPPDIAFLIGNALFGIGTGLMMAAFADVLRNVSPQTTFAATAAAFAAGSLLCLLVTAALVPAARWMAAAFLPLVSAAFYRRTVRERRQGAASEQPVAGAEPSERGLPLGSFLFLIAVMGLTGGVMRGLNHLGSPSAFTDQLFIGSVLAAGVLLLALSPFIERLKPTLLLQGAVVVTSAAFMALALLTNESATVAFVVHTVGFIFFVALVWLFCTLLGNGSRNGTRLFVLGLLANQAGQAAGSLGYLALLSSVGSATSALLPASLGTAYVLLLAALAFFANAGRARKAQAAREVPESSLASVLPSIADSRGLTTREVEIGTMVVQGKSRADIAEALVVSQETVKSHTKHLYQKLSVHSRSELLKLLERETSLQAERRAIL